MSIGEKTYVGLGTFTMFGTHKYKRSRSGRPQTCVRCGVQRRSTKDRNGKMRRIPTFSGDKTSGRWQYRPPCSDSWQFDNLPCSKLKEPS